MSKDDGSASNLDKVVITVYPGSGIDTGIFADLSKKLADHIKIELQDCECGSLRDFEVEKKELRAIYVMEGPWARRIFLAISGIEVFRNIHEYGNSPSFVEKAIIDLTFNQDDGHTRGEQYVIEPNRDYLAEYKQRMPLVFENSDSMSIDWVARMAPDLLPLVFSLLPFRDSILSMSVGPEPSALDFDPDNTEPYLHFVILSVGGSGELIVTCTRDSITITESFSISEDAEQFSESYSITLTQLFEYLRSLPRPIHSFLR